MNWKIFVAIGTLFSSMLLASGEQPPKDVAVGEVVSKTDDSVTLNVHPCGKKELHTISPYKQVSSENGSSRVGRLFHFQQLQTQCLRASRRLVGAEFARYRIAPIPPGPRREQASRHPLRFSFSSWTIKRADITVTLVWRIWRIFIAIVSILGLVVLLIVGLFTRIFGVVASLLDRYSYVFLAIGAS